MSKNCRQSPFASVVAYHGCWPRFDPSTFVADGARLIGDVTLGENSSVWFNAVVRGDVHPVVVGSGTNIQDGAVIHTTRDKHATYIGSNVTVGHLAMIHGCTVEDNCLIGMQSVIMDAARIGTNSIVGAGAVVTQGTQIPPCSLVIGAPAKVIRTLREEEIAAIRESAQHYIRYTEGFDFAEGTLPANKGQGR